MDTSLSCRPWLAAAAMVLSAMLATSASAAAELQVARSVMHVPTGVTFDAAELPPVSMRGDGNGRILRSLARVEAKSDAPLYLVVESMAAAGGRFEWSSSCKSVKPSSKVFVHVPFNTLRDECVLVQGPYDLPGSLRNIFPEAAEKLAQRQWNLPEAGYIITVRFAISSGAMLSVTAFTDEGFNGLSSGAALPANTSDIREGVIAWAMALSEEVKSSVLSLSGKWQLPPIQQQ